MSTGIIEVVQLKPKEIEKLDKAFEKNDNLHVVIGCGRTALWRARTGQPLSIDNLNKMRTYLQSNSKKVA